MPDQSYELHGVPVLELSPEGPQLGSDRDGVNLVGKTWEHHAQLLVIPTTRLREDFFDLKTRIAGEMVHRILLYKLRLAILGDISKYIDESVSFRDFVIESNRGNQIWFVATLDELAQRLA